MNLGTRDWINDWRTRAANHPLAFWRELRPVQLFVLSFFGLILFGTFGLWLLPGLYTGPRLGWIDSFFTATSAVCVTGLIVVDTATYFTPLGKAFLLILIQLGGLGIIAFTTLIILGLGRRLSLRNEALVSTAELAPHIDSRRLARHVLQFTLAFEGIGALLLYIAWAPRLGWFDAAGHAVFHAISAFCNAGFSTFSDSLISFASSPFTLVVIMALIVTGGLGFLTMEELYLLRRDASRRAAAKRAGQPETPVPIGVFASFWTASTMEARPLGRLRLSTHSKLALVVTVVALAAGWVLFAAFEWRGLLAHQPVIDRLANALFMSVTPRTAGFNTVDYAVAADSTNFLTIILMFIGGSPGSTAGGIKTTTVALVALLALARLRGGRTVAFRGRSVPAETVERAVGLCAVTLFVVGAAVLIFVAAERSGTLRADEGASFLAYLFEAASALNTVGLSMGVTNQLSPADRLLTVVLMFIGRVGPLSFAASVALRGPGPGARFRYAYEDVAVG